ncbi:hypothetical protein [Chryseosolibacter indicus]|uniref:Uncharacterized protein n=1 Tax=Chryseosolibacter indicus TaxID=2782351 RepID=A0ABS5VYG2_9BACT|nr:hypothetical protein [Chryseosolibacter indicus]MBT1706442.1 hypothetical protein [Chryseosolibacter indicus]
MISKKVFLGFVLLFLANAGFSQDNRDITTASGKERSKKLILQLPVAHMELGELYDKYLKGYKKAFRCSYLTLDNLSKAAFSIQKSSAFDCLDSHMAVLHNELLDRKPDEILTSSPSVIVRAGSNGVHSSQWN